MRFCSRLKRDVLGRKKMPRSEELIDLYSNVTTCAMRCCGIQNDPANGIMGRSFYCPDESMGIDILLVSKNPGISDPRENALYSPLNGRDRVRAHEDFVRARFLGSNHIITSRYHANIINWVSVILDVPAEHDAVFSRVAMTALVKCHSANLKTDSLPDATKDTCVNAFLYREIQLLKPKFLLALGGEAFEYLVRPSVVARHRLPVGRLYHPSWSNIRGGVARYVAEELPRLRQQFHHALATQQHVQHRPPKG
jgi:uracil-DNA glycosylase